MIAIRPAGADDHTAVRALFLEYASSLGFDLSFQDFEREVASLPGPYAPPEGCIFIAVEEGALLGCVALRRWSDSECEMKRLYVRPTSRGRGVGRLLTETLLGHAAAMGYTRMRLDTVPSMKAAIALYRALGFVEIEPYRANPIPGALFFARDLGGERPA